MAARLLDIETTCQLREEYARLRYEAGEFVVRCGQLLTLASVLPHLDAAGRCGSMRGDGVAVT